MKQVDLEPGEYTERKPKGWRWRLPWSHPDDTKLPMLWFFVAAGFVVYFVVSLPAGFPLGIVAGIGTFAFLAGGAFVLWWRD